MAKDYQLLSIGHVAKQLGISTQAVRDLERAGVVRAQRDSDGRRLFTPPQLAALKAYREVAKARR